VFHRSISWPTPTPPARFSAASAQPTQPFRRIGTLTTATPEITVILDIGYKITQMSVATFDSISPGLIPTSTTIDILRNDFTARLRLEF
jgi:hypothetical protein